MVERSQAFAHRAPAYRFRVRYVRVLLILGHPRNDSFGAALFEAYRTGMEQAGVMYRAVRLADVTFDPHVTQPSPADQPLEPDLNEVQRLIGWAHHLIFVYPNWWGTCPALMKGFLDRVLTPGFAFRFRPDGSWEKLLGGKTAELAVTMDTPPWVYRWVYGAPGHKAMARATLGFCGVRTVRVRTYGIVERSSPEQRQRWLAVAQARGEALAAGPLSLRQRVQGRVAVWLQALRLQFYPMTWIAYTVGALLAVGSQPLQLPPFWIGYLCLFALEAATVFSNEYFDYESDRRNRDYGPFNGGSRVLVDGLISFARMRIAFIAALAVFFLAVWWLWQIAAPDAGASAAALLVMTVLALGYTVPPLKLSHRGLGEVDVALTHSIGVLLLGFLLQGGSAAAWQPWLVSVPLFLSVLPSITLSGIPDFESDRSAGKRTMVVQIGVRNALWCALWSTLAAAASAIAIDAFLFSHRLYGPWAWVAAAHGLLVAALLGARLRGPMTLQGFNGVMVASLSLILWYGVVPLFRLG